MIRVPTRVPVRTAALALVVGLLLPLSTVETAQAAQAAQAIRAAQCSDPEFVTSDPNGMWSDGGYVVHNNMWNVSGYDVSETLAACSFRSWKVTATASNANGDGAVKTYPNVHKDFHDWETGAEPRLSTFSSITGTWSATTPGVGIYNAAWDIWLNGVPGQHEVMIWTDNHKQVPAGSKVATRKFSGYKWTVWATDDNSYLAFVPKRRLTHGKLNLKRMLTWLVKRGRMAPDVTLGQVCFGFEIVSTDGKPATFAVDRFSVKATR